MKKYILVFSFVIASLVSLGQQEAMFTHYMHNTVAVNPAYAGTSDALSLTLLHRSQWVGFDGAPQTQTISLNAPLIIENVGVGGSILNDKIGPIKRIAVNGDFSYKIKVSEKGKLSFGLKAGVNLLSADVNSLKAYDTDDKVLQDNLTTKVKPNFGFGMYYYTSKFYAGISTPRMLKNDIVEATTAGDIKLASDARHYFTILGGIIDLNENIKFKPTLLVKVTKDAPIQTDLSTSFIFNDNFWVGAMYRTGDAAGLLVGMNITDQVILGYSFDSSFANRTFTYNNGSHEIMLQYDIRIRSRDAVLSPRYF